MTVMTIICSPSVINCCGPKIFELEFFTLKEYLNYCCHPNINGMDHQIVGLALEIQHLRNCIFPGAENLILFFIHLDDLSIKEALSDHILLLLLFTFCRRCAAC
eukprot:TRINITY_DN72226_c0_g1_i1.p1 TRINITY_DN72226_c0_g1~~TRINITY_DN72226_c0_g1_i1.p1  ORF type:complete len:104 (+),score=10.00 TRINITY_DN72226_c0_g1_i1:74-385(+)